MQVFRNPIVIIVSSVLAVGFVIAGLLLPPISLWQRLFGSVDFTELTKEKPSLSLTEGLSVGADPAKLPSSFAVKLEAIPNGKFLNRKAGAEWEAAANNLPSFLALTGPVFGIQTTAKDDAATDLSLTLNIPSNSQPYETLDLYAWDGTRWSFVPSQILGDKIVAKINSARLGSNAALAVVQTRSAIPLTSTILAPGEAFSPEAASALNNVAPLGLMAAADGTLSGGLAGGYELHKGYAVTPVVLNHSDAGVDSAALAAVLTDKNLQNAHIQSLVDFVVGDGYDGLVLDYLGLDAAHGPAFSAFVADLASRLHAQKKTLAVMLPAPDFDGTNYSTGAYDWEAIGLAADSVIVPSGNNPEAIGNGENDRLLAWAARRVNRFKIQLVLSSLSVESADGAFGPIDYQTAIGKFGSASFAPDLGAITPGANVSVTLSGKVQSLDYDAAAAAPRFTFLDDGGATRTVWLGTSDSLLSRLGSAQKHHLGGAVVRHLLNGGNAPGVLNAVSRFRANAAATGATPLTLIWTVNSSGGPVARATGAPNGPFIWPAGQPGPYEIAAVLQGSSQTGLGSVVLTVPAMTETPTAGPTAPRRPALPTSTPCGNCPTSTPAPPTATGAPATTAAPVYVAPGASGAFELGGQAIHGGITYSADMKRAGMTWVKIQGYYGDDLAAAISNAHGLGFRILLSITDRSHAAAPVTSASYQDSFGNYLATLASQGADAIEVWNEPNIDREWPSGQVSGANYTQLLKAVYPKIKSANGNTMVISAAPAPTGFFGSAGCAPQGCNDDVFLQAVTAAGGANYLDCVGIHFNDGTTSPSATTGSALSGYHYSYYYWPMVNTYRAAFNNARQLCFTELGFLSGEGYSPDLASVAPSFSWAAGISVAQQAAWLAEAATLSRNSGQVRLMVVFNVDFPSWGADPQAGYAIERPGNVCPACDALDAVMP